MVKAKCSWVRMDTLAQISQSTSSRPPPPPPRWCLPSAEKICLHSRTFFLLIRAYRPFSSHFLMVDHYYFLFSSKFYIIDLIFFLSHCLFLQVFKSLFCWAIFVRNETSYKRMGSKTHPLSRHRDLPHLAAELSVTIRSIRTLFFGRSHAWNHLFQIFL